MNFDPETYSPRWLEGLPLTPVQAEDIAPPGQRLETHSSVGALRPLSGTWRFDPGLDLELDQEGVECLTRGFRIHFANGQTFTLLHLRPGVTAAWLPPRARPELFAPDIEITQPADSFSLLQTDQHDIAMQVEQEEKGCRALLVIRPKGDAPLNAEDLREISDSLPEPGAAWDGEIELRKQWVERLPAVNNTDSPGPAIERLIALQEPAGSALPGPWLRDEDLEQPGLSIDLFCEALPAIALFDPDRARTLIETLVALPESETGGWNAAYGPDAKPLTEAPALPWIALSLGALPPTVLPAPLKEKLLNRCRNHIQGFLQDDGSVPVWPEPEASFTPEVTDPEALISFDLSALLIAEIEACGSGELRPRAEELKKQLLERFWESGAERFVDRTPDGDPAKRLTVATLLPLLWQDLDKSKIKPLRASLGKTQELRGSLGLRQWQGRSGDPIEPPVLPRTQHLFLPLLKKLPGETAALLSADWNRLVSNQPDLPSPEVAALGLRLLPFADRINPSLERYPGWVRSLEKHRRAVINTAAAILLLIPAAFGIIAATGPELNLTEELMVSGEAETYVSIGNLKQAEATYTRLIENTRSAARRNSYHLKRGNVRFQSGNLEGAMSDYEAAIALDPEGYLYQARWNLAQTLARLDRKSEAVRIMREFIAEYGDEVPMYVERANNAIALWQP